MLNIIQIFYKYTIDSTLANASYYESIYKHHRYLACNLEEERKSLLNVFWNKKKITLLDELIKQNNELADKYFKWYLDECNLLVELQEGKIFKS